MMDTLDLKELTVKRTYEANVPTSGGGHTHKVGDFVLKTNFRMGAWCSPIHGTLDFSATGSVNGTGKAITAELLGPSGNFTKGAVYCLDCEIGGFGGAISGSGGGPVCFQKFGYWGTADSTFDDEGFLWQVDGLTEGTGHLFSAGAGALTTAGTLKIRVGTTTYYLMLASNEAN